MPVTLHQWVVFLPFPLMLVALGLDALAATEGRRADRGWGRVAAAAAVLMVGLSAFTGLSARRSAESALPDLPMPWDRHVIWAVALAAVVFALGWVRIQAVGGRWSRSPAPVLLLDLGLLLLIAAITVTGLGIS